jgi:pyrroloquinoline quinone (PQQ) biosynthesis protein C
MMDFKSSTHLLQACVKNIGSQLDEPEQRALLRWWEGKKRSSSRLCRELLALPGLDAERAIESHPAHRHRWYHQLASEVSIEEFAAFLLENWAFPAFLPLVERTLAAQITDAGRTAMLRNIEDERLPIPHADLMRRLFQAVKAKAGSDISLQCYPSLIDRTLVFYYGYYSDPWHLVGSLYATEAMGTHRMIHMGRGLERLGIEPEDLEFIRIHLQCDDDHARDWHDGVIAPSIQRNAALRAPIAEGIASCLESSVRYLDDLSRRADERRLKTAPQ